MLALPYGACLSVKVVGNCEMPLVGCCFVFGFAATLTFTALLGLLLL